MIKVLLATEEYGFVYKEVKALNHLHGADTNALQVLKSAAGYFIGALCKADWYKKDESDPESPNEFWEPNFRDSACYWATREEAEQALLEGNYPVKF